MNKQKTIFQLSKLSIAWIFLLNVFIAYFFREFFKSLEWIEYIVYIGFLMLVEAIITLTVIRKIYDDPINNLEKSIQHFLRGKGDSDKPANLSTIHPSLNFILKFFNKILTALTHIKWEFLSGKEIMSEVELAKEIQDKLLFKKRPIIPSLEYYARSKPAAEIWWDSFDVIKQWDNYYLYCWDVTGHGVASWFVMVMVDALISAFAKEYENTADIVVFTNEILKPRKKSNILMSLLIVRWNEIEKRLYMCGAWHEYLLVYKHKMKKCLMLKSWGIALWMVKNIRKQSIEKEIKFEEDDIIILYSDWITEAKARLWDDNELSMFTEARLVKTIEACPEDDIWGRKVKTAKKMFNHITIELSKFMGYKHTQYDDITLVVAHYKWEKLVDNTWVPDADKIPDQFITEWSWK